MPKFVSVLFIFLFSISAFAQQNMLSEFGNADVTGTGNYEPSDAPVVFLDQAPNQVNGYFNDSCRVGGVGNTPIADNFVVTVAGPSVGITEIIFWGGYYPQNVPNVTDNFTMIIHQDAGGLPGAVVYGMFNLVPTTRATTGVVLFTVNEYIFTFDFSAAPLIINTAGTYWVEIYNCSAPSDIVFWETGNLDVTNGVLGGATASENPGVNWSPIAGTDFAIQINGDDNIPVELVSFAATTNGTSVSLNWSTATETNNSGFEIERRSDGEFEQIGFVAGHGTTTEAQQYSYTDKNVEVGTYSYRLKQVDLDGTFEYSNEVEVEVLPPAEFSLAQNFPNPFNPSTKINYSLAVDSKVTLTVYNLLGEAVSTLVNNNITAGTHSVNFDAVDFNSGVYFYSINAQGINGESFTQVRKMMLTK
jgi:hypothetical protein